jgi:aspartate carbamoyltransferase catalytic subunit
MYTYPHKDLVSVHQLSKYDVEEILKKAKEMESIFRWEKIGNSLSGKIIATLFYEPSTRTRLSFESAAKRLGANVITVASGETSSLSKWESLEDNAIINAMYADIVVIRHPESGSAEVTAKTIQKPVINAGDGGNEHPTQALLDTYTILKEKGRLENLKIAMVWDLKYGRTTHSLAYLLSLFPEISFTFISPNELKMPEKVKKVLDERGISYRETNDYEDWLQQADVLYVTRIQKERFQDKDEYERLKNQFILTLGTLRNAKSDITIMHPLPRVNEVDHKVDSLPNAAFFRQAENWVPVRMALLELLLNK